MRNTSRVRTVDMSWRKSAETAAKYAPALGAALAGPAGAVVGGIVGRVFGNPQTDDDLSNAISTSPAAAEILRKAQIDMAPEIRTAEIEAAVAQSQATNETLRSMTTSGDVLVKRAPAIFLYILGITWFVQMLMLTWFAGAVVLWADNVASDLDAIRGVLGEIATLWTVALAVAGIGIHSDRKCKEAENGKGGQGAFSKIIGRAFNPPK